MTDIDCYDTDICPGDCDACPLWPVLWNEGSECPGIEDEGTND